MGSSRLRSLLIRVASMRSADFAGLGLVVSDNPQELPIFPLRRVLSPICGLETAAMLATIAAQSSRFHDGFHILNGQLAVDRVAQYFSPPIKPVVVPDEREPGGRYMAAQLGSLVPGVINTAVLSSTLEMTIFHDGAEVHHEKLK